MKKLQLMLLALCCSLLSVAQSSGDITFSVDMSTFGGAFTNVYVSGTFNSWDGLASPLTDMGGGIWEGTVPAVAGGVIEYKYTVDDWTDQEGLTPGTICTITTAGFTNRVYQVDGNGSIPTVCWNSCQACGAAAPAGGDITVTVDMSESGETFTQVYISGAFNGWNGIDNPLTDNGDGTWTGTVTMPAGANEFKFTADDWAVQEALVWPAACLSNNDGFANRITYVDGNADLGTVCWNACAACGVATPGCTDPTANNYNAAATVDDGSCLYSMTFEVDMSAETGFTTPAVESPLFGWCGGCAPMADQGGGIWSVTLELPAGDFEYKYAVDDFASQEDLIDDMVAGASCAPVTDFATYANRLVTVVQGATQSDVYGTCPAAAMYNVTLSVDMNGECVSADGVHVAGEFQGWDPATTPMTDADMDGVYEVTIMLNENTTYEYKFINGNAWGSDESVPGACATNNNRTVTVGMADQTEPTVCFASCSACVANLVNVDVAVDASDITVDGAGMYVSYDDGNGNMGSAALTNGTGNVWTGSFMAQSGSDLDYYFVNGDPSGSGVAETVPAECQGAGGNRGGCVSSAGESYGPVCYGECAGCTSSLVNVTFQVDMNEESTNPIGVWFVGSAQDPQWTAGAADGVMADGDGDDVWEITYQLSPGTVVEYKYLNGPSFANEETVDAACGVDNGLGGYNRSWTVGVADETVPVHCFSSCNVCGTADINVTFQVDMNNETVDANGVHIAGAFQGWDPAATPMDDSDGDGIYTYTAQVAPGSTFEYKFINGNDWGFDESVPAECATGFNRSHTAGMMDETIDVVCFGSCTACNTANVTFQVDMNEYTGPETISFINVSGEWNGWCADCNQMTDDDMDGVWVATFPIPAGDQLFKYQINGWLDQEDLTGAGSCVESNGGNVNRSLTVMDGVNQTLDVVCFGSCYACQTGETPGCTNPNGSNYDPAATVNDGTCLFDVTFQLNTSTSGVDFSAGAHLFGNFNGWCGGCAPMTDDGGGLWSLTVELAEGSYEYKYSNDAANTLQEDLTGLTGCVVENFGFTNRLLQVTDDMTIDLVCWQSCADCIAGQGCTDATANNYDPAAVSDNGSCLYDVIFTVDMANYIAEGGTFTTPEVNGSFNGWCGGCAPMTNTVDDVWTVTIELGAGDYEYQFAVDSWTDQEFGLDPAADCTIGANRALSVTGQTDIGLVCWESCSACETPVFVDVTFRVDMSNETISPDGVHIAGSFQGWDPASSEMTYLGYGIYEITFVGLAGNQSYQYKYINGNTFGGEEVIPVECNVSNNREVAIGDMNTLVDVVCFGECQACAGCTDPFSMEYNPFAGSDDGSCATAVVFGCTYADAENYDMSANSDDGSCTFAPMVNDCPTDLDGDGSTGTTDLLVVLASFGSNCP